jgi:putative addiction module component (TIGR02574 family)
VRGVNILEIQSLTVSERILLAEALWDSIVAEDSKIELTDTQKVELDRRLAAFEIDQDIGSSWSSVKARILSKK